MSRGIGQKQVIFWNLNPAPISKTPWNCIYHIHHSYIHASWHLPPHLPTFLAFPPPRNLSRPKRHKSSPRTCHPPSDVVPNGPDPPVTWREDKAYLQEANGGRFGTGDQGGGGPKKQGDGWIRGFLDFPIPCFLYRCVGFWWLVFVRVVHFC